MKEIGNRNCFPVVWKLVLWAIWLFENEDWWMLVLMCLSFDLHDYQSLSTDGMKLKWTVTCQVNLVKPLHVMYFWWKTFLWSILGDVTVSHEVKLSLVFDDSIFCCPACIPIWAHFRQKSLKTSVAHVTHPPNGAIWCQCAHKVKPHEEKINSDRKATWGAFDEHKCCSERGDMINHFAYFIQNKV